MEKILAKWLHIRPEEVPGYVLGSKRGALDVDILLAEFNTYKVDMLTHVMDVAHDTVKCRKMAERLLSEGFIILSEFETLREGYFPDSI